MIDLLQDDHIILINVLVFHSISKANVNVSSTMKITLIEDDDDGDYHDAIAK